MNITRQDLIAIAKSYMDTKFQHQGRRKGVGLDCAGVVIGVANESGWAQEVLGAPFHYSNYGRIPDGGTMKAVLDAHMTPVPIADMRESDVLLMCFNSDPQHVAIVTQMLPNPYIIHSYAQVRKVTEHGLDAEWRRRIRGVYRFTGVE